MEKKRKGANLSRPSRRTVGLEGPRRSSPAQSLNQPDLTLTTSPKRRTGLAKPEEAAKLAIARRAKPSPVPDHVRLLLTLELRRELAERLSLKAIKSERNIEAIVIALIKAAANRWR